ncbi:hypothetical protein PXK00_02590 [Phaeobacter sp. QD34_3]|uniref:hypothetical protein n=1 Tax=unclassified Phaeobacter TaxID=2621772 RepID=UPI00237F0E8C|nr:MULTISPECIES: hypothetical protein [unclassified Phaeobacter]MDE4131982.1 hypothetical protein [Phaeobacter sp. QD34_3]MDE4135620.1 hypothetical protein [Phaeobacter sp. QD34_24]MDE4173609.1 hypothetical protein [Phaeobacter sp. PT47_59]
MNKITGAFIAALALSACGGGNPFSEDTTDAGTGTDTGTDTGTGIDSDGIPPGTASPAPEVGIFRREGTSTEEPYDGNGYATDISYNRRNDTFSVDNLAFDGDGTYARGSAVSSLGPFAVYEADAQYTDINDSEAINQFTHRAIYGVSTSGNTQFAIVRTGAYADYGFGGFIYQRDNAVTLPSSGQAQYNGTLAGIRDFNGSGGLEYTTADVQIAIDFDDFNPTTGGRGDAVSGTLSNRTIYDMNGADITSDVINRINADNNLTLSGIPVVTFDVGPNNLDENGEIIGTLHSRYTDANGELQIYETGNYYAIVSGDDAEEIVGVVVLENTLDPIAASTRETGGFIVYNNVP